MNAKPKVQPVKHFPSDDPAGADKMLLKGAEVLVRMLEDAVGRTTGHFPWISNDIRMGEWWDGPNGAKSVVQQVIAEQGVPNKRFHDIVNPRAVAESAGIIKMPKRRLKK